LEGGSRRLSGVGDSSTLSQLTGTQRVTPVGLQERFDFEALSAARLLELMTPDEIYQQATQELLERLKEDRGIERKLATEHAPVIAEYVSMWANTDPNGGLIAIGMANDGCFEGCKRLTQEGLNHLEKAGRTHCPDANIQTKRVFVINTNGEGDFVLLFRVKYRCYDVARK
jgi:ATP-dependent DNA helicase RecG